MIERFPDMYPDLSDEEKLDAQIGLMHKLAQEHPHDITLMGGLSNIAEVVEILDARLSRIEEKLGL